MKTSKISFAFIFFVTIIFNAPIKAQKRDALKIISYNILYGMETDTTKGKQVFSEWVRRQDPDILALQETNYFTQKTLENLAHSYEHPYAVICKETGFPTSLTSKYPVVNVDKVLDNMWHGFVKGRVDGYNIIVLHLSPHEYLKRREEIAVILETIKQSGPFEKWIIMGDFNSVSPLDKKLYEDGRYAEELKQETANNPAIENLDNDEIDYEVHEAILNFGFTDCARQNGNLDMAGQDYRIDFIYVSPDLKDKVIECGFIADDFTRHYSDHLPLMLILSR